MKASDNPFPKVILNEAASDGSDFSNPAADYRVLFLGEDGELHLKDSSGTVTDVSGAGGDVATDAIWDAAGDLAVGSGANTAARLAIGAAGGHLSVINSAVAWNSGTSFPANKASGDRYWRTDLGMEFYWDGTRWVTTNLYESAVAYNEALPPFSADVVVGRFPILPTFGVYLVGLYSVIYVTTTNDGTKYWTVTLNWVDASNTVTSLGTFNTSADLANTWTDKSVAVGAVVDATAKFLRINAAKTSTPGTAHILCRLRYRLIST